MPSCAWQKLASSPPSGARLAERLARERRDAVARVGFADATGFPTPDELRTAMLSGRSEP